MATFKKIPVEIEAIRLSREILIKTLEGEMTGNVGDWLITGVSGEQYPCKDDIFRKTYSPIGSAAQSEWERKIDLRPDLPE